MKIIHIGVLALATACAPQALAHDIPWPPGMSRLIGPNTCAKPPCHRRVSFASSVPHDHIGDGLCIGKGAAGYAAGRRFACRTRVAQ